MGEHGPTLQNSRVIINEDRNVGELSRKVKNQHAACVTALFHRIKPNLELLVKL